MATETEILEGPPRRISPVLIVGLVVLLLAVIFFFVVKPLFFGEETTPAAAPPAATSTVPVAKPSPTPAAPPPETFEVFESKDPFRPLVAEGGASGGGTTSTGTTSGTTFGTTAGAAGAPAPSGGQRVSVIDIFTDGGVTKAQVKVGSTVYTVAPGDTFATTFKLVSISGNCATMLNGDDKFTLCKGEEVIK